MITTDQLFERTTCGCAECIEPCRRQPGPLAPGDLERIAAFLGRTLRDIAGSFWASPGAIVRDARTQAVRTIGTITPRRRAGRCVFLSSDNRCRIHPVAPFGCAYFDMHQSPEEGQRRSFWLHRTIEADADYQSRRRTLAEATSWQVRR